MKMCGSEFERCWMEKPSIEFSAAEALIRQVDGYALANSGVSFGE